jgi:hypothetical protein
MNTHAYMSLKRKICPKELSVIKYMHHLMEKYNIQTTVNEWNWKAQTTQSTI